MGVGSGEAGGAMMQDPKACPACGGGHHAGAPFGPLGAAGRAPVPHRRSGAPRCSPAGGTARYRQGLDPPRREQPCPTAAPVRPLPRRFARRKRLCRRTRVVSDSVAGVEATAASFAFHHGNGGQLIAASVGRSPQRLLHHASFGRRRALSSARRIGRHAPITIRVRAGDKLRAASPRGG